MKEIVNIADIALDSRGHGERFAAQTGEIGMALGLNTLGCMLHIVQPGKMAGPYHRHHGCEGLQGAAGSGPHLSRTLQN